VEAAVNRTANEAIRSRFARILVLSENRERAAQGISNLISVGLSAGFRQESMQHLIVDAVIKKNKGN
jgi:hypothetical protein